MIRSIIVEDKKVHSERLKKLLREAGRMIEVVGVATTVEDALVLINKHKPELLFLDIQLQANDAAGFELLEQLESVDFHVVFTTAHVDQNIEDIREVGLHFMLKPYIKEDLDHVLTKLDKILPDNEVKEEDTLKKLLVEREGRKIVMVEFENALYPMNVGDIVYLFSKNIHVTLVIRSDPARKNASKFRSKLRTHDIATGKAEHKELLEIVTTKKSLTDWEHELSQFQFCRIDQSYLINMGYVLKYTKPNKEHEKEKVGAGGSVELIYDIILPVSKSGREKFLNFRL